jgi:hypothetical protein
MITQAAEAQAEKCVERGLHLTQAFSLCTDL